MPPISDGEILYHMYAQLWHVPTWDSLAYLDKEKWEILAKLLIQDNWRPVL